MRILIVTAGSRGDVAPFTGLGQRLQQSGHHIALAAHDLFADLVREVGLEHRPLPGDPVELTRARTAAPSPAAARSVFGAFLERLGEGVIDAVAAGADLLLTAFGPAPISRLVAEGFGIPSAGVYLAPGLPTREFPPPGSPTTADLGPAGNLAAGQQLLNKTGFLYAEILPRLRTQLGLPSATSPAAIDTGPPQDWPICHGYSPAVLPRPADWPAQVSVSGYWWPARPPGWQPPSKLLDFLQAGSPPVFVGLGSMTPDHSERLSDIITTAVHRTGARAVVQSGWAGLTPSSDEILGVGDLPHDWLFPRMAALVHHAGAGTTGAGLRAGIPAIPVPVLLDQPFWATRLHHLGVAPHPLPLTQLTAATLTDALRSCLDQPDYRHRAAELAARVRAEDGPAAVLALTTRLTA